MGDRVLQVDVRRGVVALTLDSPADRDAPSRAVRAPLHSALTEAIADDGLLVAAHRLRRHVVDVEQLLVHPLDRKSVV